MSDVLELWTSPAGIDAELHYTGQPEPVDDEDRWYPDEPGQLPPRCYELRRPGTGEVLHALTVYPLAPWSPYDAVADKLVRDGWTQPDPDTGETCEHGLSPDLCSGPNHYPADDYGY